MVDTAVPSADRRSGVLESALTTFARHGYRKTSMEEAARAAGVSRPGLYFMFGSKEQLFREAVARALQADLGAAAAALDHPGRGLAERVLDAFGCWTGRYLGPLTRDVEGVIADNPALLAGIVEDPPERFAELVTAAVQQGGAELRTGHRTSELVSVLTSVSIGIKHQVQTPAAYRERMAVAVRLLLDRPGTPAPVARGTGQDADSEPGTGQRSGPGPG